MPFLFDAERWTLASSVSLHVKWSLFLRPRELAIAGASPFDNESPGMVVKWAHFGGERGIRASRATGLAVNPVRTCRRECSGLQ